MKSLFRSLSVLAFAFAALTAGPAFAAKDVVFAVASQFTTTDPYDANDTLSQAMAKSFYEGLFGFDKDMKLIPVLAEGYEVSKDGLVYTIKLKKGIKFQDGTDFKADGARVGSPDSFPGQQDAGLPQDFSEGQVVAIADVESGLRIHHACPAGGMGDEAAAVGAAAADLFDQLGNSGVGEHIGVFAAAGGVDRGVGQHIVQHAADGRRGVVDR